MYFTVRLYIISIILTIKNILLIQISQQRILSYMKRLATLSLQQLPNGTVAFLALIRNFVMVCIFCSFIGLESHGGRCIHNQVFLLHLWLCYPV